MRCDLPFRPGARPAIPPDADYNDLMRWLHGIEIDLGATVRIG
jgi:hypothetical protein